jgi:hypothetical protein
MQRPYERCQKSRTNVAPTIMGSSRKDISVDEGRISIAWRVDKPGEDASRMSRTIWLSRRT